MNSLGKTLANIFGSFFGGGAGLTHGYALVELLYIGLMQF